MGASWPLVKYAPASTVSPHRFARALVWARLMLMWLARFVFGDARLPKWRHVVQRHEYASLDRLARLVRNLIVVRAVKLARLRRRPRTLRDFARPGFRRRMHPRQIVRAAFGARLRRALRHRDPLQRLARLLDALANLDVHAAACALRAKRGLTRLHALSSIAPPPVALAAGAGCAPQPADSS